MLIARRVNLITGIYAEPDIALTDQEIILITMCVPILLTGIRGHP